MSCYLDIFILTKTDKTDADSQGRFIILVPGESAVRMKRSVLKKDINKGEI